MMVRMMAGGLAIVKYQARAMGQLGSQSRRHRALVQGESLRVRQDSLCVSAELSAGCDLIVYAKTNERIRFEVRRDRDAIAAMLRRARVMPAAPPAITMTCIR
jgi:hypothetical protein